MVQYTQRLDDTFSALSDATRRGVLEALAREDATISQLADRFGLTLTGIKKHVEILERSGLVASEKVGRVRTCRLGTRRLDQEAQWIDQYQHHLSSRLDRLEAFLDRTKGDP